MKIKHTTNRAVIVVFAAILNVSIASAQRLTAQPAAQAPASGHDVSLAKVIDQLARKLHINYVLDPAVNGEVMLSTYGEMSHLDARNLLDLILRVHGAAMVPEGLQEGGTYRIVPAKSTPAAKATAAADSTLGADMGGGFRGCVTGENSPDGTVKNGYKKILTQTPFGASCHWEQVK